MFHEICFLIQPKANLIVLLDRYSKEDDPDALMPLREAKVWLDTWDSYRGLCTEEIKVKLLFLADLHEQRLDAVQTFRSLLEEILGEPPLAVEIFDKWWEMTFLYDSPIHYKSVVEDLDKQTVMLLAKTGNELVDSWLEKLIQLKT